MIDIVVLERLADKIKEDTLRGHGLTNAAARSIAEIISRAIGAPVSWPSRVAGVHAADDLYPGSPDLRLAFNWGVKWAVEHYEPTEVIIERYKVRPTPCE